MKILYSQLKQLVPGLKADPKQIGQKFTMAGLMIDELQRVKFNNKNDWLLSFEVRQNRADCLSVIGLAREAAAYYGLNCKLPLGKIPVLPKESSKIKVKAKNKVKRALAFEITGVENKQSPAWLKEFLAFYDINSINLLVDLSNYVMVLTGYPSHLLDSDKMTGSLCWDTRHDFKTLVTLDGVKVALSGQEVIIRDDKNILGLAGIVGGKTAEISLKSKNIIAEMAIYDRISIYKDSKSLKIVTEASIRLKKDLSPANLDWAANLLVSLILKHAGGKIKTNPFSFYSRKQLAPRIKFDPKLASLIAGIDINSSQAVRILKDLRFRVSGSGQKLVVSPPLDRMDVNLSEDVAEEVIRIFGFEKIPSNMPPALVVADQITPMTFRLSEKARDILSIIGFDEILSWTLTKKETNLKTNYLDWDNISTQNSVNEEFPDLRQSIAPSLFLQYQEYVKRNINKIKLFEIGKVFGKKGSRYLEHESLGMLVALKDKKSVSKLKKALETLLLSLGASNISYLPSTRKPQVANVFSCWDIMINDKNLGIIYKAKVNYTFAEINISQLSSLIKSFSLNPVVELTQKLVILDANLEISKDKNIIGPLKELTGKIGKNLWSLELIDSFPLKDKIRYTVKVTYFGLSDQEAKAKHSQVFNILKS
ncbi:hypothetical protein L6250_03610 [Candidatus Parcubacteria bacterium]|nr:hypothetical protein [Candidatus Parcubacteria bacterium]